MTRIIITLEYGGYSHKETQTQAGETTQYSRTASVTGELQSQVPVT
jgi:hypothetical protein